MLDGLARELVAEPPRARELVAEPPRAPAPTAA